MARRRRCSARRRRRSHRVYSAPAPESPPEWKPPPSGPKAEAEDARRLRHRQTAERGGERARPQGRGADQDRGQRDAGAAIPARVDRARAAAGGGAEATAVLATLAL